MPVPPRLPWRRLFEQRVVRDLAEVPALAVQVDRLAVDAVLLERQLVERRPDREHVRLRVVAHEVEAEAVDLVLAGPQHDRVDHELLRDLVLGRDVLAARRGLDLARCVEALVVAGHDLVEHRLRRPGPTRRCGCRPRRARPAVPCRAALRPSSGTRRPVRRRPGSSRTSPPAAE